MDVNSDRQMDEILDNHMKRVSKKGVKALSENVVINLDIPVKAEWFK